ncbi:AgmX/PglI C-terminal domain-containing protein [Paraliomyxa miuraensis]|uniref:AgmX/PglI C-terminal domain-containing protein n=1 Tax=Paraliomyxa miuraensis TaxID=376150 RepID=UPI00224EFA87|nr:AgmX/PglI C-terminal domain-containing protein [Paraliomyxa miuraensis]MCX4239528.1 AgmX/PglI C-terminal domain-containing protein [Paraliomyxa miuraensis]
MPNPKPRESRAPKVLRVAVIVDDLVCDEIHQHEAASISMGSDYRSDVVLFGSRAPVQHTLFDYRDGVYFLDVPSNVRGKVSMGRKAFTIGSLRQRFGAGDKLRVKLSPRAKGKLLIGDSTVMFQFDDPKVLPPRLPFPVQFKARFDQMWGSRELSTMAVSALTLGSYFTWAATAPYDDTFNIDDLDERFIQAMGLVKKQDEVEPEPEEEEDALAEEDEEETKVEEKEKPKPEKKLDKPPEKFSKKAVAEARNVGIARVLGTYGGPGEGTVLDVIESTENDLGDLFAQGMTTTMLADGGAITPFVPGGEGISLGGSMVDTQGFDLGEGPQLEKKEDKRERKVRGRAKSTKTDVFGDIDGKGIKAQINRRMSALNFCYESVLQTRPDIAGKMTFTIGVSAMGSVTSVVVEEDTVGDAKVKTCAQAKIKGWRFGKQEDSGEVTFSVVFSGG